MPEVGGLARLGMYDRRMMIRMMRLLGWQHETLRHSRQD